MKALYRKEIVYLFRVIPAIKDKDEKWKKY